MHRIILIIVGLVFSFSTYAITWSSVNIDYKTISEMSMAYEIQINRENYNYEYVKKILEHYSGAEVATAGIFASKWLDRNAMKEAGLFSSQENYYYRRIKALVVNMILPKIYDVALLMIKHPDKALYWGPFLYKVCEETKELCMIFQSVVTNNKLTFNDIVFATISDDLKSLFDLTKIGGTDWKQLIQHLLNFGNGLTKEDIKEDIDHLGEDIINIASAGGAILDSIWVNSTKIGEIFKMKPRELVELYSSFEDIYQLVSNPSAIKDYVLNSIGTMDSVGVQNLLRPATYNITDYLTDYLHSLTGQYYTERWYIYLREGGSERLCHYMPPDDPAEIAYNSRWHRVITRDRGYSCSPSDYEESLRISENEARWSRQRCEALNNANDGYVYTFSNTLWTRELTSSSDGSFRGFAYAHEILVTKSPSSTYVAYEDIFDSQKDDEAVFQARFNNRLQELNCNNEGKVYAIKKDPKRYYTAADEAKLRGCSAVSFNLECHDNVRFGEGSFSWKENRPHDHDINQDSREYAMSGAAPEIPDVSGCDQKIQEAQNNINRNNQYIQDREDKLNNPNLSEGTKSQYRQDIERFRGYIRSYEDSIVKYTAMRDTLMSDYGDELDGDYRIPALMAELASARNIAWSDEGHWEGNTFVRHGNIFHLNAEVVFRANLTRVRKEKHIFGVRIHRAILQVSWTLDADYSTSSIVEVMELEPGLNEAERVDKVNRRLNELLLEYPNCTITPEYAYNELTETGDDEDSIHLLWVSDRLVIGREVDARLMRIYSRLMLAQKFLRGRETILDYTRHALSLYLLNGNGRKRLGTKSYNRWLRVLDGVAAGEPLSVTLANIEEYNNN